MNTENNKAADLVEKAKTEMSQAQAEMQKIVDLIDQAQAEHAHFALGRSVILRMKMTEIRRELEEKMGVSS